VHRSLNFAFRTGIRLLVLFAAVRMISPRQAQAFMQDGTTVRLRVDTRIVEIDVSVRDSQGRPVEDLKESDFTVTDNGKARAFTIFSFNRDTSGHPPDSPAPQSDNPQTFAVRSALPPNVFTNAGASPRPPAGHSTIILLDGINGWFDNFAKARQGVLGLLDKVPADEKIALYVLVKGVGMVTLQDYTSDRSKLADAVTKFIPRGMPPAPPVPGEGSAGLIELPSPSPFGQPNAGSTYTGPVQDGFTSFREKAEAVRLAVEDVRASLNGLAENLRSLPGRKSLFWVTQGFPPSQIRDVNQSGWDKTFANLNDANIAVNTVDSNGVNGPPRFWGPGAAIVTMQQVAAKTGGHAYYYRNDLDAALALGIADSRSSYTLGFYLTRIDGKYHELKVDVDRPGLQLNYRRGYYAQNETVPNASARKSDLQAALLNPSGFADVGITARFDIVPGKPRGTLNAHLTLAPEPLSIKKTGAGYTGTVEEMFLEQDADGHEVLRFSGTKQFTIDASYKPLFDTRGVTLSQAIPLAAGAVKLLIVVRDTASGRVGSLMVPLEQVTAQGTRN
jgi:VWFA-related protein